MKIKIKHDQKGQALVEFALISIVLLTIIFAIVEGGRLFQGWLTVQNSARAAGRYAITGQFDPACLNVFPPCLDPRVKSIEARSAANCCRRPGRSHGAGRRAGITCYRGLGPG